MKKTVIAISLVALFLVVFNTSFAHRDDPVFDYVLGTFNSQKVVSFTIYTSYDVPSITITSCELQKRVNNTWQPVTSYFTLTDVVLTSDSFSANIDYSSYITTGTYRVKFKPKADNHTMTCYSSSRTF